MAEWYVSKGGDQLGPFDTDAIKGLIRDGGVQADDMVWRDGMPGWVPASSVPEFSLGPDPAQALADLEPGPLEDQPRLSRRYAGVENASSGAGMSWLVWIFLLILINFLSWLFDWPFWVY
jgi:type IV pilus assembly protein PilA